MDRNHGDGGGMLAAPNKLSMMLIRSEIKTDDADQE
jgi:hypothetical protein